MTNSIEYYTQSKRKFEGVRKSVEKDYIDPHAIAVEEKPIIEVRDSHKARKLRLIDEQLYQVEHELNISRGEGNKKDVDSLLRILERLQDERVREESFDEEKNEEDPEGEDELCKECGKDPCECNKEESGDAEIEEKKKKKEDPEDPEGEEEDPEDKKKKKAMPF